LWDQLKLEEFWRDRLPDSREGTCWRHVLQTLTVYRLIDLGSEWQVHRQWVANSAMADLLDEDFGLAEKDNLYRCLDKLLPHRAALFQHLRRRCEDLFGVKHEVLLYDLTSAYFESDPPLWKSWSVVLEKSSLDPAEEEFANAGSFSLAIR
jgi:hypothetical protein